MSARITCILKDCLSRLTYVLLQPKFQDTVLIFAHMRCGSSALTQVLSTHADLSGFGEAHIAYDAPHKLGQLKLSVMRHATSSSRSDRLLDKVLHNQYDRDLPDRFLEAKALFVLREPKATIQSITNLFTRLGSHEYASHEQSAKYYIARVQRMMQLWLQFPKSRRLFIAHERLMKDTDQCLAEISTLLELSKPLVNEYQPTKKIRRGSGDPLVSTRLSKIVPQKRSGSIELSINPDLMAQVEATYLEALKLFFVNSQRIQVFKMLKSYESVVIFGGSGYIGGYTLNHLIENSLAKKVYLLDIKTPRTEVWTPLTKKTYDRGDVIYIAADVREPIDLDASHVECIFNFAAIHREPGHEPAEYFETNIKGAEHVVAYAEKVNCKELVFTSSIAPYGHAEVARTEQSQVVPYSPYGSSKLVAEKIHESWQSRNPDRYLVIVRPGVIFGPHEDGNVPRLKTALKKGLFCYVGNKSVRKSGGYVKELVTSFFWVLDWAKSRQKHHVLYNFSFPEPPKLESYVEAIKKVGDYHKPVPVIPYSMVLAASYVLLTICKPLGIHTPAHPQRIKKLKVDNQIIPQFLIDQGYPYKYDLIESLRDWKSDAPHEW